ncbi:hypothetical protein [Lacrimispora sp.]|uniref:hypothetical protein n=1 Tax=Lacrimispora sp. TaxID=2719234 RepID=UPI00289BAEAE|nr:hypothetical protein [Lacrimispora sp.]
MKKKWNVIIDGNEHEIAFKPGVFRGKMVVDGVSAPIKSTSMFIRVFDEPIELEGKTLHLTAIGSKVDLAVDDIYLNSKKPYVPLNEIPRWAYGFTAAIIIIGWILCGLFGILVGTIGGVFVIKRSISPKHKSPMPSCLGVSVLCVVIQFLFLFMRIAVTL